MKIYLDMDDVVADWHQAAQDFLQMRWDKENERIPQEDWNKIKKNSRFYLELPLKEGAGELVAWAQHYCLTHPGTELRFLTALPHDNSMPWAAQDKVWWAHRHFPGVPVFFGPYSHDKHSHAQRGDLLIDDRYSNCREWVDAGGIAHVYKDWATCRPWLETKFGKW